MNINSLWKLIERNEGRVFQTISGLEFNYTFHGDYIVVSRAKTTRLYKSAFEKALNMDYSSYMELGKAGIRGHNYVYVIIKTLKEESVSGDFHNEIEKKPSCEKGYETVEAVPSETHVATKQKMSFGKQLLAAFASYMSHIRVYSITTIGRDSRGRWYRRRHYKIVDRII